jgi:hypothetical protein
MRRKVAGTAKGNALTRKETWCLPSSCTAEVIFRSRLKTSLRGASSATERVRWVQKLAFAAMGAGKRGILFTYTVRKWVSSDTAHLARLWLPFLSIYPL